MPRNNILEATKKVLKLLKNNEEHSINQVADELKMQWKTSLRILEFLKEIGLVKERKGKKTYCEERLFSLK